MQSSWPGSSRTRVVHRVESSGRENTGGWKSNAYLNFSKRAANIKDEQPAWKW